MPVTPVDDFDDDETPEEDDAVSAFTLAVQREVKLWETPKAISLPATELFPDGQKFAIRNSSRTGTIDPSEYDDSAASQMMMLFDQIFMLLEPMDKERETNLVDHMMELLTAGASTMEDLTDLLDSVTKLRKKAAEKKLGKRARRPTRRR